MSLITDFPFHAFIGDLGSRQQVDGKHSLSMSLMTSEDIERISFVDVTVRCGIEDRHAPWRPVERFGASQATFYDTRMGNFDARTFSTQACSTCAQTRNGKFGNERCQGHFGSIVLPHNTARMNESIVVYNPHMFTELMQLLQAKCFFCHQFRARRLDVARFCQCLRLMDAGLVGEALHFMDVVANAKEVDGYSKHLREAKDTVINDEGLMANHVDSILASHGFSPDISHTPLSQDGHGAGTYKPASCRRLTSALDIRNDFVKRALSELRGASLVCNHCHGVSPRIEDKDGLIFFHFGKGDPIQTNMHLGLLSLRQVESWEEERRLHNRRRLFMSGNDAKEHIKRLCSNEAPLLASLFPHLGEPCFPEDIRDESSLLPTSKIYKVFFLSRLLVPPLPLRLSSGVQVGDSGSMVPDATTSALSAVLGYVEQIQAYYNALSRGSGSNRDETKAESGVTEAQTIANESNLRHMQQKVHEIYTLKLDSFAKKEGLFRMHMMGKRVNQACRSVISPDYMIEPNVALMPRPFARRLSYPEQVAFHAPARAAFLKQCVINGPNTYPGATHLELPQSSGEIRFISLDAPDNVRRQHAEKYFAQAQSGKPLIVYRHLVDGDRCIFNRQPTLHKPSMMGYRLKVCSGLKTLRFHYVNGKSFNADFDGDEMNIHVPQSLEARAELECLMDANLNYLVATSGKPIRGLIQDHVAAGVLLTTRDKFLDHDTFTQYLYFGLAPYLQTELFLSLTKMIPLPAILKPKPLWTGKQLVSCIVKYVSGAYSRGMQGISLRGMSLIQPSAYQTTDPVTEELTAVQKGAAMGDDRVIFLHGELLSGAICKNQLGPSSMSVAHVIHEVHGPHAVSQLFGAIGRVLTLALQREGFSIGMDDVRVHSEKRRRAALRQLDNGPISLPDDEAIALASIMQDASRIQKEFVPGRMLSPFPKNQLLMMTVSGAKGSNTNTIQMALGLGQQLFDGRRVKRMGSGKTLPPFFMGETRARSFGYAIGSFTSGIRPGEYTIHAMAGRDGLIDTAVKTSRSGHLQRCLIKGMESYVAHWDHTVRDSSGSIIQFMYGGDGLDPCKASTLTAWEMMKDNLSDLANAFHCQVTAMPQKSEGTVSNPSSNLVGGRRRPRDEAADEDAEIEGRPSGRSAIHRVKEEPPREATHAFAAHDDSNSFELGSASHLVDPYTGAVTDPVVEKVLRDAMEHELQRPEKQLPKHLEESLRAYLGKTNFAIPAKVSRLANKPEVVQKRAQQKAARFGQDLHALASRRRLRAFCDDGEPVGLLAAQAAGEPSTQMTLNTFHSAGSTVTHVTEGIPRLRELLIYASVGKPAVIVPVEGATAADELAIAKVLRMAVPVKLADCLVPLPQEQQVRYQVYRGHKHCELQLALLCSESLLKRARFNMGMNQHEHLHAFLEALRAFARKLVNAFRGRVRGTGAADEGMRAPVQDPEDLEFMDLPGAALGATDSDGDSDVDSDDDNIANRYRRQRRALRGGGGDAPAGAEDAKQQRRRRRHRQARASTGAGDRSDLEGSGSEASSPSSLPSRDISDVPSDVEGEELREAEDAKAVERRENLLMARRTALATAAAAEELKDDYTTFAPIQLHVGGRGEYMITIQPDTSIRSTLETLELGKGSHDMFDVRVTIRMPSGFIAVVPDVTAATLSTIVLPTWIQQFESATLNRSEDNHRNGQLVFQGPTATVRAVVSLISMCVLEAPAIQLHNAHSTDIRDMVKAFGVESGYKSLYGELDKLFKRYAVDHRHLTLIADAATHRGVWESFNFTGVISRSTSPLFQMTFASSKKFLHTALTRGIGDDLKSLSSSIMVGGKPQVGTGTVRLMQDSGLVKGVVERVFK